MNLTLADAAAPAPPAPSSPQQPGQTGATGGKTGTQQPAKPGTGGKTVPKTNHNPSPWGGSSFFILIILVIAVMWIFMIGGQRKEKKKRAKMLEQLSKGAKVQTIGGILGTVVDIRGDEVVVKVDENANTRLRFARSAIQTVLEDKSDS